MVSVQEKQVERILKAFANRRRIAILLYLKKTKEASVGDIAGEIKLSIKSTSRHLGTLSGVGIVDHEQRGLQVFYSIAHDMPELARRVMAAL
jgi:DNA-binding transcriptional ArsR family regulator